MPHRYCLHCCEVATYACACCGMADYCGRDCQKADYAVHKHERVLRRVYVDAMGDVDSEIATKPTTKKEMPIRYEIKGKNANMIRDLQENFNRIEDMRKKQPVKETMTKKQREFHDTYFSIMIPSWKSRRESMHTAYFKDLRLVINQMNTIIPPVNPNQKGPIVITEEIRRKISTFFRMQDVLLSKFIVAFMSNDKTATDTFAEHKQMTSDWKMSIIHELIFGDSITMTQVREAQKNALEMEKKRQTALRLWELICDTTNEIYRASEPMDMGMFGRGRTPKSRIKQIQIKKTEADEQKKEMDAVDTSLKQIEALTGNRTNSETVGALIGFANETINQHTEGYQPNGMEDLDADDMITRSMSIWPDINWKKWVGILASIIFTVCSLLLIIGLPFFSSLESNLRDAQKYGNDLENNYNTTLATVIKNDKTIKRMMEELADATLRTKTDINNIPMLGNLDYNYNSSALEIARVTSVTVHDYMNYNYLQYTLDGRLSRLADSSKTIWDELHKDIGTALLKSDFEKLETLGKELDDSVEWAKMQGAAFLEGYTAMVDAFNTMVENTMMLKDVLSERMYTTQVDLEFTSSILEDHIKDIMEHNKILNKIRIDTPFLAWLLDLIGQENILTDRAKVNKLDSYSLGFVGAAILGFANVSVKLSALLSSYSMGGLAAFAMALFEKDTNLIETCYFIFAGIMVTELIVSQTRMSGTAKKMRDWFYELINNKDLTKYTDENDQRYNEWILEWKKKGLDPSEEFEKKLNEGKITFTMAHYARAMMILSNVNSDKPSPEDVYEKHWSVWYEKKKTSALSFFIGLNMVAFGMYLHEVTIVNSLGSVFALVTSIPPFSYFAESEYGPTVLFGGAGIGGGIGAKKLIKFAWETYVDPAKKDFVFQCIRDTYNSKIISKSISFVWHVIGRIISPKNTRDAYMRLTLIALMTAIVTISPIVQNTGFLGLFDAAAWMPFNLRNMTFYNDLTEFDSSKQVLESINEFLPDLSNMSQYEITCDWYKNLMDHFGQVYKDQNAYTADLVIRKTIDGTLAKIAKLYGVDLKIHEFSETNPPRI